MKHTEATMGRIFVLTLEEGEILHTKIEAFAKEKAIDAGALIALGGVKGGSELIVGPKHDEAKAITSISHILSNVHEITGTGTIFPDENHNPILHMHIACGRNEETQTGCVRNGVIVWKTLEVVLIELSNIQAVRQHDPETGLQMLEL